ncbi:MAG: hypothetical protein HYT62_00985 [Candidatus Yanofskybacteria bacterium]|nr:hypothetical protein [Candidatus Yanofskybacteria bacterium]
MCAWQEDALEGCIILDSGGRRVVRGGKEYPMSEEEYRKLFPLHRDTGCKDCTHVNSEKDILLYFVARETRANIGEDFVSIGNFCLPFFTDHHKFYLFKCCFCGNACVSYIHGGGRRLWCPDCRDFTRLSPGKHRDILINHGLSEKDLEHYEQKDREDKRFRRGPYVRLAIVFTTAILTYFGFKILG